jgi:co-chaperonin GroES (HSP10)
MRTKTLLIAATALAVGIGSSLAQTYSQNIVGYVNQVLPANAYSLLVAPLANTTTNNAEQILTCLQTGDEVLFFNGSGYNFDVYIGPGTWIDGVSGNPINAPLLPPGVGFFYQTGAGVQETNTAVGVVVLTNSIALPLNSYNLVGSTAPIAGSVESTNFSLPLQTGDQVLIYNGSGYNFDVYISPGSWIDGVSGNPIAVPTVTVGQGFFYQTGAGVTEQWNQNVVVQ